MTKGLTPPQPKRGCGETIKVGQFGWGDHLLKSNEGAHMVATSHGRST